MEKIKLIASIFITTLVLVACKDDTKSSKDANTSEVEEVITDSFEVQMTNEPIKKSNSEIKAELEKKGFKTFNFIDEETQDTILMQQYFMVLLKSGPIRPQNEEEAEILQQAHLDHLSKMYQLGYADISGPFGDNGNLRGVTIYNVPTLKMADSLAKADPMVKAGRLEVEIHPWWAAKGFSLR